MFNLLFAGLVLPALALGRVLEDVRRQLMPHVHLRDRPTGLAQELDVLRLVNVHHRLRIPTRVALDEALDETLEQVDQLGSLVCAVDD